MKPAFTLLTLAPILAAATDQCAAHNSCATCAPLLGCGWCEGQAYNVPTGSPRAPCVPVNSTTTWKCDGKFKTTKAQCSCQGTNIPAELEMMWRGFYIDGSIPGEVSYTFLNKGPQGRVTAHTADGTSTGNVTTFINCPKNQLQIAYDDGKHMACTYMRDWQSGGDAYSLSLGCNPNAVMPADFDTGKEELQLFACTDPSHCPFRKARDVADAPKQPEEHAAVGRIEAADPMATNTSCESITTCGACAPLEGCHWCLGRLEKGGRPLHGEGHCFGAKKPSDYICAGLTLETDCTVFKCPWFEYYGTSTPNCNALTQSCLKPTTADDPDFYRKYIPASGYVSKSSCEMACVDPTVGCLSGECNRTHTCDPTSSCNTCIAGSLPKVLQGIELSAGYEAGLYTFRFTTTPDNRTYTSVNVTTPSGSVTHYAVLNWGVSTATFVSSTTGSVHGVRLDGLQTSGALGTDIYLALGDTPVVPPFGAVMITGGSEFALLACEMDGDGHPVSGEGKPIACKIGELV